MVKYTMQIEDKDGNVYRPAGVSTATVRPGGATVEESLTALELGTNLEEKTYEELRALADSSALIVGKRYILSDYMTVYFQPYTKVVKSSGVTEKLILTAVSANTFDRTAYSLSFPQDLVTYDFRNCETEHEETKTSRKGLILRRYDRTLNIDCPGDWRTQKWPRFRVSTEGMETYDFNTGGAVTKFAYYVIGEDIYKAIKGGTPDLSLTTADPPKNYFVKVVEDYANNWFFAKSIPALNLKYDKTEVKEYYTFDLNGEEGSRYCYNISIGEPPTKEKDASLLGGANNVFKFTSYAAAPHDINALDAFVNNTIGNNCLYASFAQGFMNNTLDTDCGHQNIGPNCFNNIFGAFSGLNTFQSKCYNNIFGAYCHSNNLGVNCYNNYFGDECYSIVMDSYCHENNLGYLSHGNRFGSYCFANTLGHYCSHNSFESNCSGNVFQPSMTYVTVANNVNNTNFKNVDAIYNPKDLDKFRNCYICRDTNDRIQVLYLSGGSLRVETV